MREKVKILPEIKKARKWYVVVDSWRRDGALSCCLEK
jgi:hypothetical protein